MKATATAKTAEKNGEGGLYLKTLKRQPHLRHILP